MYDFWYVKTTRYTYFWRRPLCTLLPRLFGCVFLNLIIENDESDESDENSRSIDLVSSGFKGIKVRIDNGPFSLSFVQFESKLKKNEYRFVCSFPSRSA